MTNKIQRVATQVVPVRSCSDEKQLTEIMRLCGIPRSLTYNKLGSLQGWGLSWKKADPIVRAMLAPADIGLPGKIWEWAVNDTMKAISAQQAAAITFIIRSIYRKFKDQEKRDQMIELLYSDPTSDPWLHRIFRNQYIKGHTFVRNQVVYQGQGYTATRLGRNTVKLEIQGLKRGAKIVLMLKVRNVPTGQIRVIKNEQGELEVHFLRTFNAVVPNEEPHDSIGVDKGYTEAFFTSEGEEVGAGLGRLLTEKTRRITATNRNRYRLRSYAENNPKKSATILENNLGYKVKSRKLAREKATIRNLIRRDLRRVITAPVHIFAEDLSQPIRGKRQAKGINRKLNQWM